MSTDTPGAVKPGHLVTMVDGTTMTREAYDALGYPPPLPHWAEEEGLDILREHPGTTVHTAQSHERVLLRTPDGTVYLLNRGRGLTSLTREEAEALAAFLAPPDYSCGFARCPATSQEEQDAHLAYGCPV